MSFQNIKGQEKAIQLLQEHMRADRLRNGFLFVGPEGVGKMLTAKTLAKTLNCEREALDSCDTCVSCRKIEKNQHPDIHIIDARTPITIESEREMSDAGGSEAIKINHIRQLQKEISLRPYEGKRKVFIIDDAHQMTAAASNALLKILEEPPASSLIVLVSAHPALFFRTITSRCQIVKFYSLERSSLEKLLKSDFGLDKYRAHFLAYFCEGRIGSAIKLMETDCMAEKNRVIDEFFSSPRKQREGEAFDRATVRQALAILASWYRDLYIAKTGMPQEELIHLDRKDELSQQLQRFSFLDLQNRIDLITETLVYVQQNVNIKLLLSNLKAGLWNR